MSLSLKMASFLRYRDNFCALNTAEYRGPEEKLTRELKVQERTRILLEVQHQLIKLLAVQHECVSALSKGARLC